MMQPKKFDMTYIFGSGRSNYIYSEENFPKEFFYGYFDMRNKLDHINFIEFIPKNKKGVFNTFLFFLSKLLRKVTKLSFFIENVCTFKNFRTLLQTKHIVLTNDRIGISLLPLLIIFKIFKINKSTVFVMGLLAKDTDNLISHIFQRYFLTIFFKSVNNFIFLSKGECEQAKVSFKKHREKFYFIPFCVDTTFWKDSNNSDREIILFIGNDGRREYNFVLQLASRMPEYKFIFITSNINKKDLLSKNVTLIKGQWNEKLLSDLEIRDIYNKSILSIIPIKNSYQPSGQSVALQSMAMNVPVMITNTSGFWDKDTFLDNKNIFFIEKNNIETWKKRIDKVIEDKDLLKQVTLNSKKLVNERYNTNLFFKTLEKIIEDN